MCCSAIHSAGRAMSLPGVPLVQPKKANAAGKPPQRVIKKYPNRRLYDTDTSTYITLAEVKHLVMDHEPLSKIVKGQMSAALVCR